MRARKKIKIRKSTRYIYSLIAIILLLVSSSCLSKILFTKDTTYNKKEIYSYTNKFDYNYTVNLIENKYIDTKTLGMNETAYITDLIDNINMNLNYSYYSKTQSEIDYKYRVIGKLEAVYTRDGVEQKVWQKDYVLLEEQSANSNGNEIKIDENIILNLKEQNDLVKDFEQKMGMTIDAKFVVSLEITTNTKIEQEDVTNKYNPTISIDLGQKTTTIKGDNNKENTEYIATQVQEYKKVNIIEVIFYSCMFIASIIMIIYIYTKTEKSNRIKNEFRQELNRILRLCQDKIVKVSNNIDINKTSIIDVKDFGEVMKLSEELFKPILYWYSNEKEEAWFYVMSNHVTYRYILKK